MWLLCRNENPKAVITERSVSTSLSRLLSHCVSTLTFLSPQLSVCMLVCLYVYVILSLSLSLSLSASCCPFLVLSLALFIFLSISSIDLSIHLSVYLRFFSFHLSFTPFGLGKLTSHVEFFFNHTSICTSCYKGKTINNQSFQDSIPKWYVPIYALTPADLENQI